MLPPNDPQQGFRSELPPVPSEKRPVGYHAGWQLEERLQALGVMLLGLVGLWVAYAIFSGILPAGLPPPQPPPGVLVPVFNPMQCLVPIMALGSVALVLVGARRFIDP
jgi:hypothetical protein